MKKLCICILILCLLAVPAFGSGNLVNDAEGLLTPEEAAQLEAHYASYTEFTPILVTTESFDGLTAEQYAGNFYDSHGYPEDGILMLVSLTEGEWYILTNGDCYIYLGDWDLEDIGETLAMQIRCGNYYYAFEKLPVMAQEAMTENEEPAYGWTILICMGIGLLIGLVVMFIMAIPMKTVNNQSNASDYVRAGSMQLTEQRDIFLYSQVTRTPKPKNTSSGSSGGGGNRGGTGGKI